MVVILVLSPENIQMPPQLMSACFFTCSLLGFAYRYMQTKMQPTTAAGLNLSGWLEHFHPVMENGVQSGVELNPLRKCVHQSKQKEVYTAAQQIAVYVGATS